MLCLYRAQKPKPFEIMAVLKEPRFADIVALLPKPSSLSEMRSVKILTVRYTAERRAEACQAPVSMFSLATRGENS